MAVHGDVEAVGGKREELVESAVGLAECAPGAKKATGPNPETQRALKELHQAAEAAEGRESYQSRGAQAGHEIFRVELTEEHTNLEDLPPGQSNHPRIEAPKSGQE